MRYTMHLEKEGEYKNYQIKQDGFHVAYISDDDCLKENSTKEMAEKIVNLLNEDNKKNEHENFYGWEFEYEE